MRFGRVTGRGALVLGSTQNRAQVDERRAAAVGIDVIRRTTGGGAVLVAADAQVWLDFWVPRADELWDDDIIEAATWLGDVWVLALKSLGAESLDVHRGPVTGDVLSGLVCFAGLGPGEVYVGPTESRPSKVMGLAQRRTHHGARFHTSAPLLWDSSPLLDLLDLEGSDDGRVQLEGVAVGLGALNLTVSGVSDTDLIGAVEDAVLAALP